MLVLVLVELNETQKARIINAGGNCEFVFTDGKTFDEELLLTADVVIGNPNPANLINNPRLKLLQLESAGADPYIKPGILPEGCVLTNATGAYSPAVAESAFAATLMLQKKLHLYRDNQRQHRWTDRGTVGALNGSTVAVVGLGDIGEHYARLVKNMGAYVIGIKRRPGAKPEAVDEIVLTDAIETVLPRADVVMSVLPGTAETYHFFTKERFERMKPEALFVNCGRGSAVALDVLYEVLSKGVISAAAIDVSEFEPLPEDSKLWDLENLLITPHIYGGHHLAETVDRIANIAAGNLKALCAGEHLKNIVDFKTGYKK